LPVFEFIVYFFLWSFSSIPSYNFSRIIMFPKCNIFLTFSLISTFLLNQYNNDNICKNSRRPERANAIKAASLQREHKLQLYMLNNMKRITEQ